MGIGEAMKTEKIKLTKHGEPDGRQAGRLEHLEALAHLLKKPTSIEDCMRKLGVSQRAIYWWLEDLKGMGVTIAKVGGYNSGKYVILDGNGLPWAS